MTLTLDIPPEVEKALEEETRARGISMEEVAQVVLCAWAIQHAHDRHLPDVASDLHATESE